jgi:surface antigen
MTAANGCHRINHSPQAGTNLVILIPGSMMLARLLFPAVLMLACAAPQAGARIVNIDDRDAGGAVGADLPPYLQCVPYARRVTGINIFGDAHTWWGQAEGRYARGTRPKVGAVMAFRPSGNSRLGHVAAVSKIIDSRTVLIRHSNWSPINGRRGQIEDNVRAIDVSPDNDWSEVRVWYAPVQALGGTHWPLSGFIYPAKPQKGATAKQQNVKAKPDRSVADNDDPIAAIIKRELGL